MNKIIKYCLILVAFSILIGCNAKVTTEDLIGGSWEATAGYKDGKPEGEPYGSSVITEGLEFIDEETVYVKGYDEDFEYWLEENGKIINFRGRDLNLYLSYHVTKINENEIGLIGEGEMQKDESCYLERK